MKADTDFIVPENNEILCTPVQAASLFVQPLSAEINFIKIVADMRRLQREYFRTRDPARLRDAKSAESIVDRMIKEYDEVQQKAAQPDLSDFQGE